MQKKKKKKFEEANSNSEKVNKSRWMPSMPSMPSIPSMPSMPSMPNWSSSVNQPTDLSGNIELQINEKNFNTELKRVNIEVFIPRNAQIIVRDYAKNNVAETLHDISNIGVQISL